MPLMVGVRSVLQAGDDEALADLDEMIFGKKESTTGSEVKGDKKEDLISF
jgi:hypothetical protein